jgi:hypothetical protein
MAKYREFRHVSTMAKMDAIRLLCEKPGDVAERSRILKSVERAASRGDLEIHRGGTKGAGRNTVCLDTVATQPFFEWAAEKWPEIEDDDHLGPILVRTRELKVGLDVVLDPALDLPDDPVKAVEHLLVERDQLLQQKFIAQVIVRDLEAEIERLRVYESKVRDWSQKKSESLSGKPRMR